MRTWQPPVARVAPVTAQGLGAHHAGGQARFQLRLSRSSYFVPLFLIRLSSFCRLSLCGQLAVSLVSKWPIGYFRIDKISQACLQLGLSCSSHLVPLTLVRLRSLCRLSLCMSVMISLVSNWWI